MKVETDRVLAFQEARATEAARDAWLRATLGICAALAAIIALFWGTAASMIAIWSSSETYAHGYFIVPIALVLVWRNRRELSAIAPQRDYLGFVLLAFAGFAWLVASAAQVQILQQYALAAMLPAAVIALAGRRAASAIAFPLAFVLLAVPFGEGFLPRLMDWTADFTVGALRLTGIPVYREGTFFAVPSGQWSVVEACSGLRYLIASVTVGALFAYLNYQRYWKRAAFMLLAVAVPIFANFLRAYLIVMIGHLSDMKLAVGVDHFIYGWVFFGIVIGLLFWLGSFWRDPAPHPRASDWGFVPRGSLASTAGAVLGVAAVAAVWPLYAAHLERDPGRQAIAALANPAPAAGWAVVDSATDWRPQYVGAAASTFQVYRKGEDTVAVYLGYYRDQRQGAELISSQNTVQALPRWHYAASGVRTEDLGGGALEVRQTELRGPAQRLLVWEWFHIGERELANPYVAKALLARDKLLGRGDASAVIILAAPFDGRTQAATDSLRRFARDMRPSLLASLASLKSAQPE